MFYLFSVHLISKNIISINLTNNLTFKKKHVNEFECVDKLNLNKIKQKKLKYK